MTSTFRVDLEPGPPVLDEVEDLHAPAGLLPLVASDQPSVVFSALAAACVPDLCDGCTIDLVEDARAGYRIVSPGPDVATGRATHRDSHSGHRMRRHFSDAGRGIEPGRTTFEGTATFTWRSGPPTVSGRALLEVLVEHAVQLVVTQRTDARVRAAAAKVQNLTVALETSRQIGAAVGILMSLHKIAEPEAFELLRRLSQRTNRKLRDLALDVIDTGWLDPAMLDDSGDPRRVHRD